MSTNKHSSPFLVFIIGFLVLLLALAFISEWGLPAFGVVVVLLLVGIFYRVHAAVRGGR